MRIRQCQDRQVLFGWMAQDPILHLYKLADLDDHFFANTEWYVLDDHGIRALVTVYHAPTFESVIAHTHASAEDLGTLLTEIRSDLPQRFHALVGQQVASWFLASFVIEEDLVDLRMGLKQLKPVPCPQGFSHRPLVTSDLDRLQQFYDTHYPTPFYDENLVAMGGFEGLFRADQLIAVAGVHTLSETWRVAALGNIAVAAKERGKGLGKAITSLLCARLTPKIQHIGLNVHATNTVAQSAYTAIGFETRTEFRELTISAHRE